MKISTNFCIRDILWMKIAWICSPSSFATPETVWYYIHQCLLNNDLYQMQTLQSYTLYLPGTITLQETHHRQLIYRQPSRLVYVRDYTHHFFHYNYMISWPEIKWTAYYAQKSWYKRLTPVSHIACCPVLLLLHNHRIIALHFGMLHQNRTVITIETPPDTDLLSKRETMP